MFQMSHQSLRRAIARVRNQLPSADVSLRHTLYEELTFMLRVIQLNTKELKDMADEIASLRNDAKVGLSHPTTDMSTDDTDTDDMVIENNTKVHVVQSSDFVSEAPLAETVALNGITTQLLTTFRKGLGYYDLLMFGHAAMFLKQVVERTDHPMARLYLAAAEVEMKQYDDAKVNLDILRDEVRDPLFLCAVLEIQTQVHLREANYEAATEALETMVELLPDHDDVWYNLALCYLQDNHLEDALSAVTQALEIEPLDPQAMTLKGAIELRLGAVSASLSTTQGGLVAFPDHPNLLKLELEINHRLGNLAACLRSCRMLMKLKPNDREVEALMFLLLLEERDFSAAISVTKRKLSTTRNDPTFLLQLGIALLLQGDADEALRVLHATFTFPPEQMALRNIAIGRCYAIQGNHELARSHYAKELHTDSPTLGQLTQYYCGLSYYEEGKFLEAEQHFARASALESHNPAILLALAATAREQGHQAEAKALDKKADEFTHR